MAFATLRNRFCRLGSILTSFQRSRESVSSPTPSPTTQQVDSWRTAVELGAPRLAEPKKKNRLESLFRQEAVEARQHYWLGDTLVALPLATSVLSAMALLIAISIVAFLALGEYTRKERVLGEIQTSQGVAKIVPPLSLAALLRTANASTAATRCSSYPPNAAPPKATRRKPS